jgi:Fe-S-cluster containining protein
LKEVNVEKTGCSCKKCKEECRRLPGWFTPEEAAKAIEAGYAPRMSAVVQLHHKTSEPITALAPSIAGSEGKRYYHRMGRCTFLNHLDRCEIHQSGFKPVECRLGFSCRAHTCPTELEMFAMWNTLEGKAAVEKWRSRKDLNPRPPR